MELRILGGVCLLGVHVFPRVFDLRQSIVDSIGEGAYKSLFASISLFSLVLMVIGRMKSFLISVWQPTHWSMPLNCGSMVLAFYSVTC